MTPLLFAMVDMMIWSRYLQAEGRRWNAHARTRAKWDRRLGWWRSCW